MSRIFMVFPIHDPGGYSEPGEYRASAYALRHLLSTFAPNAKAGLNAIPESPGWNIEFAFF
jgi:hypothetical protein